MKTFPLNNETITQYLSFDELSYLNRLIERLCNINIRYSLVRKLSNVFYKKDNPIKFEILEINEKMSV